MATDNKAGEGADALAIDATTTDAERLDTNDADITKPSYDDTARVVDHRAEQALCRKFDYRLLPVLALMCKCSIGNRVACRLLIPVSRSVQCARQGKLGQRPD
jgi:hypothetical protein